MVANSMRLLALLAALLMLKVAPGVVAESIDNGIDDKTAECATKTNFAPSECAALRGCEATTIEDVTDAATDCDAQSTKCAEEGKVATTCEPMWFCSHEARELCGGLPYDEDLTQECFDALDGNLNNIHSCTKCKTPNPDGSNAISDPSEVCEECREGIRSAVRDCAHVTEVVGHDHSGDLVHGDFELYKSGVQCSEYKSTGTRPPSPSSTGASGDFVMDEDGSGLYEWQWDGLHKFEDCMSKCLEEVHSIFSWGCRFISFMKEHRVDVLPDTDNVYGYCYLHRECSKFDYNGPYETYQMHVDLPMCADSGIICPQWSHFVQEETMCAQESCTVDDCCPGNPTCSGYDCGNGWNAKQYQYSITCAFGDCEPSECCDAHPTCATVTCSEGTHVLYPDSGCDHINELGQCIEDESCCHVNPDCSSYTCPSTAKPRATRECEEFDNWHLQRPANSIEPVGTEADSWSMNGYPYGSPVEAIGYEGWAICLENCIVTFECAQVMYGKEWGGCFGDVEQSNVDSDGLGGENTIWISAHCNTNWGDLCAGGSCTHDECCVDLDICDECGTCDVIPENDCFQDCDGVWGGPNNIPGDVSADCQLNVLDVIRIVSMILNDVAPAWGRDFDINGDGNRNILDVVKLVGVILDP